MRARRENNAFSQGKHCFVEEKTVLYGWRSISSIFYEVCGGL
jgi:hypothetical protein